MSATGGQHTDPTRARLGRSARNILLTVHIVVSVGLLGDSAGFLAVAIRSAVSDDPAMHDTAHELLGMFALLFGIPLSFLSLLTGVALGVGTRWGVLRYPWVITKLALIVTVIIVGATVLRPVLDGLDILVNNAANTGLPVFESIWDATADSWRSTVELNVNVPWELTKRAAGKMRERGGLVIDVTSSAGLLVEGPLPLIGEPGGLGAAYGTTKAALNQMSLYLGNELRSFGISVVAFEPGFTRTEATEYHATQFGVNIDSAHSMEPVAQAIGFLAASPNQAAYSGRVVMYDEILENESSNKG